MSRARIAVAALFLFLVVAVDFTNSVMSFLVDGMLVAGVVFLLYPLLFKKC